MQKGSELSMTLSNHLKNEVSASSKVQRTSVEISLSLR